MAARVRRNRRSGWTAWLERQGALTPVQRYAEMLSGTDSWSDGSEWYFPERLTIDTGAVGDGNGNRRRASSTFTPRKVSDLPRR